VLDTGSENDYNPFDFSNQLASTLINLDFFPGLTTAVPFSGKNELSF